MSSLAARIVANRAADAEGRALVAALAKGLKRNPQAKSLFSANSRSGKLIRGIASGSPYLWDLIRADPERLVRLLEADPDRALGRILATAMRSCDDAETADEVAAALRRLKQKAALLIALCDIGGVWDVPAVTEALTRTADRAASLALRFLLREAIAAGRLEGLDPDDPEEGSGLIVLAMGKHGAFELNYSSDIDLILFYDPAVARPREGLEPGPLFVRIAQGLVKLLSERTADGYVFRVDLRLRPDPGATAVAISLPAAFAYYESVGQNWERAALIKARPCAGDIDAGERFLSDIAPFIWRRHLDYAAIADVHAMKRQIQAYKGHEAIAVAGHDLKLGRGGIREIEFFVQTQQLIAGGRNPALRSRSTLETLATLCDVGWIDARARDELTEAYLFLRRIEHRLQMVEDAQTHSLPRDAEALERFSLFAGYAHMSAFSEALIRRLEIVQGHYGRLFEAAPELAASAGSLVFTGKEDDPETMETLARLGFSRPPNVAETVRGWHFGRYPAMRSARAREDLTELTPALLEALSRGGRPDEAFAAFDNLLAHMPSGYQLLSILRNNPRLLDTLALVLGVAPRLAELLAARPHALDGMLEPPSGAGSDEDAMEARLAKVLAIAGSYEDRLDLARIFVRERLVIIGARLLAGEIGPDDVASGISALAVAAIRVLLKVVEEELARIHGRPPGAAIVVLAMGKLGGRELTATSDLDLIVIYDHDEEAIETDGDRPIAPSAWFARLTQRLIAALSAPTAQGTAFSVDMRLRPSGRKGPVAVHRKAFAAYQRGEAWTWEHMALTRARVVAGSRRLARKVGRIVTEVLTAPRDRVKTLDDVAEMRRLLEEEKGTEKPWALKTVRGGLIDIEFIAQALQLVAAHRTPEVLAPSTAEALDRLRTAGAIDVGDHEALSSALRLYATLTQFIRLCVGEDFSPKEASEALKARLAAAAGQPDFAVLHATIVAHESVVIRIFRKVIDRTKTEQ